MDIVGARLVSQRLDRPRRASPHDVVHWLGAVQAQDYPGAAWAVGQRSTTLTRASVDAALTAGSIVRTHILRPTWHLVAREDLRWMLQLTAPRVKALMAFGNRQSGLDDDTFAASNRALASALAGGRHLTRLEVGEALRGAGLVISDAFAVGRMLMRAELDGLVGSGAMRGSRQTYALLDERVPPAPMPSREQALSRLASRFFASHGPATSRDFAWWSGLTVAEATRGASTAEPALRRERAGSSEYWSAPGSLPRRATALRAHLLPNYDEYTVGYADRSAIIDVADAPRLRARADSIFTNVVILEGRIIGTWTRRLSRADIHVTVNRLRSLTGEEISAIHAAAARYGAFVGLAATVEMRDAPAATLSLRRADRR